VANQEQLELLKQGVEVWNTWYENNPEVQIDLSRADLSRADLSGADLSEADLNGADLRWAHLSSINLINAYLSEADLSGAYLTEADLSLADLSSANLRWTNLSEANLRRADLSLANLSNANLSRADLSNANLSEADLSNANLSRADLSNANLSNANFNEADLSNANLSEANFSGADLSSVCLIEVDFSGADLIGVYFSGANLSRANLSESDFSGANLSGANLSGTNLSGANLSGANLSGTNFSRVQGLNTNLTGARLTGTCIEDWNINSQTKLDEVECDYIYLEYPDQERRPSDPNRNFEPGEFTKLFQKALSTVDLIFRNGVDWQAFAYSFKKIQVEHADEELAVQSIENKGDGIVVVRVNISPDADKGKVQGEFMQGYEFAHQVLEERYRAELSTKDTQLVRYGEEVQRQQDNINNLFFLINQQQAVQKAMAETSKIQQNFNAPVYGVIGSNEGVQNVYAAQDLAEAAQQIQDLLNQLQKTQGVTEPEAQQQVATDLATQAKNNPTMMGKLVKLGQSMATKAGETTVSEAVKAVVALTLKAVTGI